MIDPVLVQSVFQKALDLAGDARGEYLAAACAGDPSLRRELDSLLGWHARSGSSLAAPLVERREGLPTLATGASLGPYRIEAVLGAGGMGIVYRASHARTAEHVALKTVRAPSEAAVAALRGEVRALARLAHPGVVRVLEDGIAGGMPWYAMELVTAPDLRRLVALAPDPAPGQLSADVALVLERLCAILGYVHGEGVVHRDLKPSHVLIRPGLQPVLVDFGLASSFAARSGREAIDESYAAAGTVAYMAPEQIRGEPLDPRADLYALGCILFEVVTGRPPFLGDDPRTVLQAHLAQEAPRPSSIVPGVASELDDLVSRLLAKAPASRIGYADVVGATLARVPARASTTTVPAPSGTGARPYLYRPRLVGRDGPLGELRKLVAAARDGEQVLALVGGESGVGKTRLLVDVAVEARASGIDVVAGECPPPAADAGGPSVAAPLQPFRRMLQRLAARGADPDESRRLLGDDVALLAPYEPALADLASGATPPPPLPPAAARRRLFEALARSLGAMVAGRPHLLVIDDLQWADELSLGFLSFLASRRPVRSVIVAAYRSDEATSLAPLLHEPSVTRIELPRLADVDVAAMVSEMLAREAPEELVAAMASAGEGNPFFTAEYLRAAIDEGLLRRDELGHWTIAGDVRTAFLPLPDTIRELLSRRLGRLGGNARLALRAACVLGREVERPLVTAAAGIGELAVDDALDELTAASVLESAPEGGLRFAHDKLREVAYARLEPEELVAAHRAAASAMEACGATGDERQAMLGLHWQRAGKPGRAATCYARGAEHALRTAAFAEAERLLRAHLALEPSLDVRRRNRNRLVDDILEPQGRHRECADEQTRLAADAASAGDRSDEMHKLCDRAFEVWLAGDQAEAESAVQAMLDRAMELGERLPEAVALNTLGVFLRGRHALDEAEAAHLRGLAIARDLGIRTLQATTTNNLGNVAMDRGRHAEARTFYLEAAALHRAQGNRRMVGISIANAAAMLQEEGRLHEARGGYEEALAIAREVGDRGQEALALLNLVVLFTSTDPARARDAGLRALDVARALDERRYEAYALNQLADLEAREGHGDRALSHVDDLERVLAATGIRRVTQETAARRAFALRLTGNFELALRRTAEVREELLQVGDNYLLWDILPEMGHALLALGRDARPTLAELQAVLPPEGPPVVRAENLAACIRAAEAGTSLLCGEIPENVPPAAATWLRGHRPELFGPA